jgi:indole-3-acetate O-methyltransferase
MHWLSKIPLQVECDKIHANLLPVDAPARKLMRLQAHDDLVQILVCRANELANQGSFVLVLFCVDDEGQYLGNTKRFQRNMLLAMNDIWSSFADQGKISTAEFKRTFFCNYYRTSDEIQRAFQDPRGKCSLLQLSLMMNSVSKLNLALHRLTIKFTQCPYANGRSLQTASEFAKAYIPTTRTWSNSTFFSALDASRSLAEREQIVSQLFIEYERQVSHEPEHHGMDYVMAYLTIRKQVHRPSPL